MSAIYLILTLCLALNVQNSVGSETNTETKLAIDINEAGIELKFPFFLHNLTTIPEELKEVILLDTDEVFKQLVDIIDNLLGKSYLTQATGWPKKTVALTWMAKNQYFRRSALKDTKVGTNGKYNLSMKKFLKNCIDKSNIIEKELKIQKPEKNPKAVKTELKNLLDAIQAGFKSSPVVNYVAWDKGTINGNNFGVHVSDLMARMKYNGVGKIIDIVDTFIDLVVFLSGNKSSSKKVAQQEQDLDTTK